MSDYFRGQKIDRSKLDRVISRPPIPPFSESPSGQKRFSVSPPEHFDIPSGARPFYVIGFFPSLATAASAAAASTIVTAPTVPVGMIARILFFEQQMTNFSPAMVEDFVETQLLRDTDGIAPYVLFNGILSRRDFPKRRTISDPVNSGQVVTLKARVLPTAEGGLDGGTVNYWASIYGWFESAGQTA